MSTTTVTATKWAIDPTHSEVSFKVKHLVISTVTGNFKSFEGGVESDSDDFQGAEISFAADIASIDTNQSDRDNHLKSADFFDAEKYPKMTFTGILEGDKLKGELTIKETTKDVELSADFGGIVQDPYGQTKAGFELEGKISRKEFGLTWNAVTEAGSVVVSDQVRILANIQIVKQ
ncbi:YceI family protein [Aquiflexum gelatinilyticum]|uniref:YceI family protein n=1 Tax=Aquiflexum gelatinilyticum TaxID=2961943 RepID=A0A9X2P8M7_9BACT|nr:YceI family protein [Aquiflexum gelatinilyticum]MCR9016333.1 YceI family protein [Aquiflexum gelatinilyticum]